MYPTKIIDLLTGKHVSKMYDQYQETQWYSSSDMEQFRMQKLRRLLEHCYINVPYYSKWMKGQGLVPSDVTKTSDISIFPILTKEILKANYKEFIPQNLKKIAGVKYGQTGGTTGSVLYKRNDANTRSSVWAAYRRFYDWMGVSVAEKNMTIYGGHQKKASPSAKVKSALTHMLKNEIVLDAYDPVSTNVRKIIDAFQSNKIALIRGYSQAIHEISLEMRKQGVKLNLKAISTTAEPLYPEYRSSISAAFQTDVYDQYGCGEIGSIGFECSHHCGLHITEERVIVEFANERELIITDLDNYAMPFIRYWNADEAELSNTKCSCGRESALIKAVIGRTSDYLMTSSGERIHWGFVFHLIWESNIGLKRNLVKFQLVQESENRILFRIVSDPLTDDDREILSDGIRKKLGDIPVAFVQENAIENSPSGKFRPVVVPLEKTTPCVMV